MADYAHARSEDRSRMTGNAPSSGPFLPGGGVDLDYCCEGLALVAEAGAWSPDPAETYGRVVDAVAVASGCAQVHLHLISEDGDRLVRTAYHAERLSAPEWSDRMDLDVGRLRWMVSSGLPLVTDFDNPREGDRIPEEAVEQGARSAVTLPLRADDGFVGACTVVYVEGIVWDEARLAYLMRMGRVIATTVKRVRSFRKASELLALDERKRVCVEMHNGVASLLASLALTAAAAAASCDEGAVGASTRAKFERLEELAGRAMRILRSDAMALRIPFEATENLAEAYVQLVDDFREIWGVDVELSFEPEGGGLAVPPDVSLQLVRILNECFSNIIHHARASRVRVVLARCDGLVTLTVEDDGRGFDVDAVPASCMGLKIMRERAASVGGSFAVVSDDGGTAVLVDIPC